jgi:hypothetical protein
MNAGQRGAIALLREQAINLADSLLHAVDYARAHQRPPRRRADLGPQPPTPRLRREPVAAGHLCQRRQDRDDRGKRAAGEKNVLVHGAATAQLALAAGLLDELELHVIPVLLGQGRRLFDKLPEHIELQRTRIIEGEDGVTHMHYRVQR